MKFFANIMSIYLLVLCCIPCNDKEECNINTNYKISSASNHSEHNHANEACSPFCNCTCCAASAFFSPLSYLTFFKFKISQVKYSIYKSTFRSDYSFSIWQPPQLA